jgi:glycosyltransferase involved in cell wall biosynthesis
MIDVSVILPVKDRATTIGRAISSVLNQTWPNWELIIIDEDSRDRSVALAKTYAQHDPRIQILAAEGKPSHEVGRQVGRGELITFLEPDDYYEATHFQQQLIRFEVEPELMMLLGTPTVLGDPFTADVMRPGHLITVQQCVVRGTFWLRPQIFSAVGKLPRLPQGEPLFFYERVQELGLPTKKVLMPTYIHDRRYKELTLRES